MAIANTTSTVTVNAAFLKEIKDVNQDLWQIVSELGEVARNPRHHVDQQLRVCALRLAAGLHRHHRGDKGRPRKAEVVRRLDRDET